MKRLLIAFFSIFLIFNSTYAQQLPEGITEEQIRTINIDDLSDDQIRLFVSRFNESGYSMEELELGLAAKGMPQIQIDKLKARMASVGSSTSPGATGLDKVRSRDEAPKQKEDVYDMLTKTSEDIEQEQISERQKKIFGYDLFKSEMLSFEPSLNIATPKDYQLGSGDELIIDVWGASEITYQEVISPDGFIKVPNLGPIYVGGLNIDRASQRIKNKLTKIYSGIQPVDGSNPNTFMQVSLGRIRSIKIAVVGEVLRPGTFDVSSFATAFNALYLSGGPNLNGSLREIEIVRDNKIVSTLDAYEFLVKGEVKKNIRLQDNDVIRIKPYVNRVEISGEVKHPGIYETLDDDTFEDLIDFAGGFTEIAYSNLLKVKRNNGRSREFLNVSYDHLKKINPQNGDLVQVEPIINRFENRVQIQGAVFRPGEFQLSEGLTVRGLIDLAEGMRGDAFLERATIYRTLEDYSMEVLPINLRAVLKGDEDDIKLRREDVLRISSIYDLQEEFYLKIFGQVTRPGVYPFLEGLTVEDFIVMAGGMNESAYGAKIEIARRYKEGGANEASQTAEIINFPIDRSLGLSTEASNFVLLPFDHVFIRKSPGYERQVTIQVEGEALFPGEYTLSNKDERISDLIKRAGGLTNEAYAQGATLIRRTELNPPLSDRQTKMNDLGSLYQYETYRLEEKKDILTEPEAYQYYRLENIKKEYEAFGNEEEDQEVSSASLNLKRKRLTELYARDSIDLESFESFNFESIGIELVKIMENPGSKYDLILQDGDVISVPKKLETVRLRGEFLYPITVRHDQKNGFKDYVAKAGGYSQNAKRSKSYIIYANGSVDRTRKFLLFFNNYPKVEPGAEIIVPAKPERNKLSATEIVAITSALATLALTINNLTR